MPPRAAEFAVGRQLETKLRLLVNDFFDLDILDAAQLFRLYLTLLKLGARLLDARRAQQAAHFVGAKRRFGSLH